MIRDVSQDVGGKVFSSATTEVSVLHLQVSRGQQMLMSTDHIVREALRATVYYR